MNIGRAGSGGGIEELVPEVLAWSCQITKLKLKLAK